MAWGRHTYLAASIGRSQGLLHRALITGLAVFLATSIVPGIEARSFPAGLAAVLVLTLLNVALRPLLYLFSLPLILVSLGLFMIVINALLLQLTAFLVKGFVVSGFWPSVFGAIVISGVTTLLSLLTAERRTIETVQIVHRPPRVINPEDPLPPPEP
jgi:putative membrane protein